MSDVDADEQPDESVNSRIVRRAAGVDRSREGLPMVALGGYVGGLLAGLLAGPAEVSFCAPVRPQRLCATYWASLERLAAVNAKYPPGNLLRSNRNLRPKKRARFPVAGVITTRRLSASQQLPDHLDRLHRAARVLCGSPHDAEDLVQETFARVLARPRRLRRDDELPYLLGALRNTYLTSLRTASRRPRTVELPAEASDTLCSTLAQPEMALEQRELLATIAALPGDFRDAVVAVDLIGLSYREAAQLLDTPEPTVTTRLYRARRRIAHTLAGKDRPAAAS
jgi:RNA polymerase sigma-70 factor (ECF subfamily)